MNSSALRIHFLAMIAILTTLTLGCNRGQLKPKAKEPPTRPSDIQVEVKTGGPLVLNTGTPNPSVSGQAITFTGSGATDGNATTKETIVLMDTASFAVVGHTTFDPSAATGSNGAWTITTSSLAPSATAYTLHAIEVSGAAGTAQDGNSNTESQTVNQGSTKTTVVSSTPNPSAVG